MAWVGRKYKLYRQEKYDVYMASLGVSEDWIKRGLVAVSTISFTKNGDEYTYTSENEIITTKLIFKLGEKFEVKIPNGTRVNAVVTMDVDGNTFTEVQQGQYPTTIVRAFTETECVTTVTYGNIVCTRWFKVV